MQRSHPPTALLPRYRNQEAGRSQQGGGTALDPLRVDPKDFKLEFENPQVRVLRLKMGPRQSVPMHEYVPNRIVVYHTDQNVRETSSEGKPEVVGLGNG